MSVILSFLIPFATITIALVGGVFLAFSDFIMRSLARSGGPAAMQSINREVFRWIFMTLFLGMAAVSALIAGLGLVYVDGHAGTLMAAAGILYLGGCFGVTVVLNVPMNEALAGLEPDSDEARAYWTGTYLPRWTFWNSVRSVACVASAGLLLTATPLIALAP